MSQHSYRRAVGKVINYLFFVLPRLVFWHTVEFIAIVLGHLTKLVATTASPLYVHPQAKDTPEVVSDTPVDSVTEEFRAEKRRRHDSGIKDWDHQWAGLLDSALEQPAEGSGESPEQPQPPESVGESPEQPQPPESVGESPEQPQPPTKESSNEQDLSGLGDERVDVQRDIFNRLRANLLALSRDDTRPAPPTEEQLTEAGEPDDARPAPEEQIAEAGELLAADPRTMWAWAQYLESLHSLPVSNDDARQVLAAILPGDHVEIFAPVAISQGDPRRGTDALPREARFAAKTFDCWILPSLEQAEIIPDSDTKWHFSLGGSIVDPVAENHYSVAGGRNLTAYADKGLDWLRRGVGGLILRLPDSPLVPVPPELGTGVRTPSPEAASPSRLLSDWHTAEDVALWHMSGRLGFFGSRLTGGVSDRGVDVEHPEAVAQVKMQATPVGSPQIRQLRGARPHLRNHVFYSTSGFTRAAIAEAAETGVALFTMDDDARVRPHGAHAKRITLEGHERHGGDDGLVAEYVSSVVERVHKANSNYGSGDASWALRDDGADWDRLARAESYLKGAVAAVKRHPKIGVETHKAVISHFRNADLRAAFFCHVLGLPYPGDEPLSRRKPPTAADFY